MHRIIRHVKVNYLYALKIQLFQGINNQISSPFAFQVNLSQQHSNIIPNDNPFEVKFLTRHIKICAGCRNGYARSPNGKDLSLVHKEQHLLHKEQHLLQCCQQSSTAFCTK